MQAVYQWLINEDVPVRDIEQQFVEDQEMRSANAEFFSQLLNGVVNQHKQLSKLLAPHVSRPLP